MQKFVDYLKESVLLEKAKAILPRSMSMVSGSKECKTFTEKETRRIISTIKRHSSSANNKLAGFIEDVEDTNVRNSDTIILVIDDVICTLYSSLGILRTGAGGDHLSSKEEVQRITSNNIIDFWRRDPQVIKK